MSYSATVLADSPTAYYRLDETSGTSAADSTGNGNTGTYQGTFTLAAAGLLTGDSDKAVSFAGAGNVLLPSTLMNMATATTPFSIEAWFQTTMAGNGGIVCARQSASGNPLMTLSIQAGKLHIELRDSAGVGLLQVTISDTLFNDGVRHHVVVTRDSSKVLRVYVDGCIVYRNADTMTGSITSMTRSHIGWEQTNNWRFNGTIDEVAFYQGVALSVSQIVAHYTAGSQEATTESTSDAYGSQIISDGATGFWRLAEGAGVIRAVDATGNGNHGARRKGVSDTASIVPALTNDADSLDGTADGRIDLPINQLIAASTDDLSLEAWIKQSGNNATIIGGRSPTSGNPVMDLVVGFNGSGGVNGVTNFFARDNAGGTGASRQAGSETVNDGLLHHIVLTRTGSDKKWRIYVDGGLVDTSVADSISAISGLDYLSIGSDRANSLITRMTGSVDEVAIYKGVALSAGQVLNHYNLGRTTSLPFIGSVTAVHAPTIPVVPLPFIASQTTVYAPALQAAESVPFIGSVTVVYAPTLTGPEVDVPFIASRTHVWGIFSLFDPDKTYAGPGNGGETFLIRLAANGVTETATLAANIGAGDTALELTGDGSLPSSEPFVAAIDDEIVYLVQLAPGSYRIRRRGVSNTIAAAHTAGATVSWGDSYDQALVATEPIAGSFTADITGSGSTTYPGWLVAFDSTQAYLSGDRYPMHVTQLLGVFGAGAGSGGSNKCDAAQPNVIASPTGTSDDCPAALSNPSRITTDIDTGDVAIVRYTNPEASVLDLGARSVAIQSWFGLKRVDATDNDVTFTDPNGIVVDTTGGEGTYTGSVNATYPEPLPLDIGIAPDASDAAATAIPTPNTVPWMTTTLPGSDRKMTHGPPGYNEKGWPFGVVSVRQGDRRVPRWQSWDWHNFSYVYTGFGDDETFAQIVINRNGIVFGPLPAVDLPGPQDIDGPDVVWDDASYFFATSWYVAIFGTPYLVIGPSIGGSVPPPGAGPPPPVPIVDFPGGTGGAPGPPHVPPPAPVEGGSGGDITPPGKSLFQAAVV